MTNPRTTICGAVAAAAAALAAIPTLPAWLHTAAVAVAAVAVALLGFFASDAPSVKVPVKSLLTLALLLVALCGLASCSIAGVHATAVIPTIGDYSLAIAGGTIGNRPLVTTNGPTVIATNSTASIGSETNTTNNLAPSPPNK
jgi:hypothetical protein